MSVWVPSRVRGRKRKMVDMELNELYRKTDTVLGDNWEFYTTGDSWLMMRKGFKYLPEIIDSAAFSLARLLKLYNIDFDYGIYRLIRNPDMVKKGIKGMYPHAAELMEKVNVKIKKIKGLDYGEYYFCWPVNVVGLEEVMGEVERLLEKNMFSKDNLEDRRMIEELEEKFNIDVIISREELKDREPTHDDFIDKHIEYENKQMKWWGEFFKGAHEIHRKYNVEMWFLVVST